MVTRGKASETELAYIAGVVDSDGHIGIDVSKTNPQRRISPRYQATVSIVNTHLGMLQWVQHFFGGSIRQRTWNVQPHHKPTYHLKVSEREAAEMCRALYPYLIIKKIPAACLLELKDEQVGPAHAGKGARLSEAEVQRREAVWLKIKRWNDDRGNHPQRLSEKAPQPNEIFHWSSPSGYAQAVEISRIEG